MKKKKTLAPEEERLSPSEISMLLAEQERSGEDRSQLPPHDTSDRAHVLRYARSNKLLAASVIFLAVALLCGAALGIFLLWRHLTAPTDTQLQKNDPIFLIYGDEDPIEVPYDELVIDGIFYVDLWEIADRMDLTVSGTRDRLRFTSDNDSYLLIEENDPYAILSGTRVKMEAEPVMGGDLGPAPAILSKGRGLVALSFLQDAVTDGFSLKLDSKTNTLRIRQVLNVVNGDVENATPASVLFCADSFEEVIFPMDEENVTYEYSYTIDVSPYLDHMLAEHLILANKSHALSRSHEPSDLTRLTCATATGREFYLREDAAEALSAMMLAMEAGGVSDVYVTSAYRTYAYQETLYEGYVRKHMNEDGMSRAEAEAEASTYSSRPGESEHQTGLCLDFTTKSMLGELNEDFENTEAFAWLSKHAHEFGFILRYPKSRPQVEITGYDYEPWHYRFVGRYAATEIYMEGLTLEEYLGET